MVMLTTTEIRTSPVPFFIKPITNAVAGKVESGFLATNFKTHYDFLEGQLKTSPDEGGFLCGKEITAADIMLSFPWKLDRVVQASLEKTIHWCGRMLIAFTKERPISDLFRRSSTSRASSSPLCNGPLDSRHGIP